MTSDAILTRLAEIARLIESHRATVFLLKQERAVLLSRLRGSDWQAPELPEKVTP